MTDAYTDADVAKAKIEASNAERDYWVQRRAQLAAGIKADEVCLEWWELRLEAQRLENASIARRAASEALDAVMSVILATDPGTKP
jgi:hypothetical protein